MATTKWSKRLDFVIFGSTGYTGQFVVREVIEKAKQDRSLSWGVAGRSRAKTAKCLREAERETGFDCGDVKVIVANTNDLSSLKAMTSQAKVVLNCVGPYRFHGEPVVRACVESGTNYVDITGEPDFLEEIELKYSDQAKNASCYVIGSCGFDCLPNDMGITFCKKQFDGRLCAVESFIKFTYGDLGRVRGYGMNSGTWNTLVHSLSNWREFMRLKKKPKKPKLPEPAIIVKRDAFSKPFEDKEFYVPLLAADETVVYRSQRDEYLDTKSPPVNASFYINIGTMRSVLKLFFFGFFVFLMSLIEYGRSLLLKYPSFFSGGIVYKNGPPREIVNQQGFHIVMRCLGYASRDRKHGQPDKYMTVNISGPDMAYVATSSFIVESAYTILREKDKLPRKGGVLTSGYAFRNTSIIDRLQKRNITFRVVDSI